MTWTSNWPDGSKSVRGNESAGTGNMSYIENKMKLDHYWNEDANKDGHHKIIQMTEEATDPALATGMDGSIYLKSDGSRIQGFYRNTNGIYQFIPAFLSGTVNMSTSVTNIVAVPANVYGEIFMWNGDAIGSSAKGFFHSDGTKVYAFATSLYSIIPVNITFTNTTATDLNIKGNLTASLGTTLFNYRITYRAK